MTISVNSNLYDPAFWSRLQFGFTLTYHYLFPQLTMGLAWFLVYFKWRALRTGDERYNRAVRLWARIFGLNFAVGVVTGIAMAFFTDFRTSGYVGLLDWYTISVAVFAAVILAAHGANYLTLKTEGPVHDRSASWARYLWMAVIPLFFVISVATFVVRPDLPVRAVYNPFLWLGSIVTAFSVAALISGLRNLDERRAFIGSNLLLVGLLVAGSAAIFPVMLHSTLAPENSLTAYAVASNRTALILASIWWPIGFLLAATYFVFISRRYAGKVSVKRDNQGFY